MDKTLNVSIDYLLGIKVDTSNDRETTIDISGLTENQKRLLQT